MTIWTEESDVVWSDVVWIVCAIRGKISVEKTIQLRTWRRDGSVAGVHVGTILIDRNSVVACHVNTNDWSGEDVTGNYKILQKVPALFLLNTGVSEE